MGAQKNIIPQRKHYLRGTDYELERVLHIVNGKKTLRWRDKRTHHLVAQTDVEKR